MIEKEKYYEEQGDYYERYVAVCITKTQKRDTPKLNGRKSDKRRSSMAWGSIRPKKPCTELKYTAEELRKKGILIKIESDEELKLKRVQFVITPRPKMDGQWSVEAKYLGVNIFKTIIVLSDLLERQYEGTSILTLDDRAQVNINLLIHLLNKKFHAKLS